mgnify:FL=1
MSHLYGIFFVTMLGTSLFAMNKQDNNSGPGNPKNPVSCYMKAELWGHHRERDTGTEHTTYRYHDGSKSTYTTYKNSSDKKN